MSHFTVLVIGENPEEQLQPYHEYECTGIKDQYVFDVDKTEEVSKWLLEELFVGESKKDGKLDSHFSEKSASEELKSFSKIKRQEYLEMKGTDIFEEIKDYHGYEFKDGKWIRFTNPNKKWDWYQLGGRWTGFFKLKLGANGETGEPGIMTASAEKGYADVALKKDIDFEFMRNEAANKASQKYDFAFSIIGQLPVNETWESIRERIKDTDKARNEFWEQPRCKAWKEAEAKDFKNWPMSYNSSPDDFVITKEEYIQNARNSAISTFAVIKDSKWYERGSMGWFGCVSDEKDTDEWEKQFSELLDSIPDDTLLSVYDCHI